MGDATLKPSSGDDLVLSNDDGSAKIEVNEAQNIVMTGGATTGLTIDTSGNAEFPVSVKTDTISEKTADTGVTIDGTLIKDNTIKPASGQSLVLQEDGGTPALTIDTSGNTTLTATLKSSGTTIYKSNGSTSILSESGGTATLENTRVWRTDIVHLSGWYDGSSYQSGYYGGELDRIYPPTLFNGAGEKAYFHWYIPDDCSEINTIDIIWYQQGNPTSSNQGELNFTTRVVINNGYTLGTNTTATVNLGSSSNGQLRETSVAGSTLLPTQTPGNYVIFEAEFDFSAGGSGAYTWMVGSLVINWR